jgi:hypothetical protein
MHKEMGGNMRALGWFWGSIRIMTQKNQRITIRKAIGECPVYSYIAPEYDKISATEKNLNHQYFQDHHGEKRNRFVIAFRKLLETFEVSGRQERRIPEQGSVEEAGQQLPGEEGVQVRRCNERTLRTGVNPFQLTPNRQELESEQVVRYKEKRKREFIQEHEEHSDKIFLGVTLPQLTRTEMGKVEVGLMDLFKTEVNPTTREFKPKADDSDDWECWKEHTRKHWTLSLFMW